MELPVQSSILLVGGEPLLLKAELLLREFIKHRLALFEFTLGEVVEEGAGGGCAGIHEW